MATGTQPQVLTSPGGQPNTYLEWDQEPIGMEALLQAHKLPQVIKLYGDDYKNFGCGSRLDLTQPFVLYEQRSCTKVLASNLYWDDTKQDYSCVGQQIIIPSPYIGWFQRLQEFARTTPAANTVGELANSRPQAFISKGPLKCFRHERIPQTGQLVYAPNMVNEGDLLTVVNVITHINPKPKSVCCFGSREPEIAIHQLDDGVYLRCLNEAGADLFIPVHSEGEFYPVGLRGPDDMQAVHRVVDLICSFKLPVQVKLVLGQPPASQCAFTGMIRLEESYKQDSVLACTLAMSNPRMVEFPAEPNTRVLRASNVDQYSKFKVYAGALKFCREKADAYASGIKVTQQFYPEPNPEETGQAATVPRLDQKSLVTISELWDEETFEDSSDDDLGSNNALDETGRVRGRRKADPLTGEPMYEKIPYDRKLGVTPHTRVGQDQYIPMGVNGTGTVLEGDYLAPVDTIGRIPDAPAPPVPSDPSNNNYVAVSPPEFGDANKVYKYSGSLDPPNRGYIDKKDTIERFLTDSQENYGSDNTLRSPGSRGDAAQKSGEAGSERIENFLNKIFDYNAMSQEDVSIVPGGMTNSVVRSPAPSQLSIDSSARGQVHTNRRPPPKPPVEPPQGVAAETGSGYSAAMRELRSQQQGENLAHVHTFGTVGASNAAYGKRSESPPMTSGQDNTHDSGVSFERRYSDIESASEVGAYQPPGADAWLPPENLEELTVTQVCESLRFIGIKEAVVTRFSREQIDGKQLKDLDESLLKEGFPEMNALERKKVLDFQRGWRPKRT